MGGEGHHCLNEKVAGGSTREDEKAVEAAGDKGPVTVNSPATDPCPDCGGRKYLAKHALNGTYYVHCYCPKLKAIDRAPAVCVWTRAFELGTQKQVHGLPSCGPWSYKGVDHEVCPNCLKPIKFTDGQMSDQIKELVVKLRDTIMTSRGLGQSDEELVNPDGPEAADALEALADEVERLKRMLFPYAEDKEISGVTWNGFYLIGNKKSIDEFKRLENRAAQLETYRAEFVRRNEAAEAERDRLKEALLDIKHFGAGFAQDRARKALGNAS